MGARWVWGLAAGLALAVTVNAGADRTAPASVNARLASAHAQNAAASQNATKAASSASAQPMDPDTLVSSVCVDCHYEDNKDKTAGLSFENFKIAEIAQHPDVGERMIRKLRAGMMPPPPTPLPDAASYNGLINALETRLDAAGASKPNPGGRVFQRLNRTEYASAIKDLLGLEVNAGDWLPLDSLNSNFDNIADEQMISATLIESYLNAASEISRMAVGDRQAPSLDRTFVASTYESQHPWDYIEGAPYGTRGGMVVKYVFPADGDYVFVPEFIGGNNSRSEDLDISIDGVRVALVRYETQPSGGADGRGGVPMPTEPIKVSAGQHVVSAAFVRKSDGPYEDLIRPHDWSFAGGGSGGTGITTLPHLRQFTIRGPKNITGVSDTVSRQRVFTCRPTSAAEERTCARTIVTTLGSKAYRRPVTAPEADALMKFYDAGVTKGGFESGVRMSLEAMLASPRFIFRLEDQPANVKPGDTYRISDYDLASRLSFFLWGMPPDQELMNAAGKGQLSQPAVLEQQAKRMLADPRSEALGTRFAAQWLRLQDLDKNHPDPNFYPNFNDEIASAMRTETVTFFNSLVHDDKSVLDLYRADYTYLNETLARHYGIPGVAGDQFRKVQYPDSTRKGLLGQGSRARPDVARQPHVARAARQVGHGSDARHAAASAAGQRAAARQHGRSEERPRADDARAHGDAPEGSELPVVPPLHGSDRPGARQLRRHRASGATTRTAIRSTRAARSTTARRCRRPRSSRRCCSSARCRSCGRSRKTSWPLRSDAASSTSTSRRCARSALPRKRTTTRCLRLFLASSRATHFG